MRKTIGITLEGVTVSLADGEDAITDALLREADEYNGQQMVTPRRIGIVGSAVLRDCYVNMFAGNEFIMRKYPTTIGVVVPLEARDMFPVTKLVTCKLQDLKLKAVGAPTTNQLAFRIEC